MKNQFHVLKSTREYRRALGNNLKDRHVIELGVGTGALTTLLLDAGAESITGYEIVPGICKVNDPRLVLHEIDYTTGFSIKPYPGLCIVANPAYSTLPYIIDRLLPHINDVVLMVPEKRLVEFNELGFRELFRLAGKDFEPVATGIHCVVARGFDGMQQPQFIDLHYECSRLKADTIPGRLAELSQALPSVSLCGLGGFPFVYKTDLRWAGVHVSTDMLKKHFLEALGLSALLTYTNKRNHSLSNLGLICNGLGETWAYHWVTVTMVLANHSPAVHLAFARDTRFKLGWTVEKEYTGKLLGIFAATASIRDWIKFSSKKDDVSFDSATRTAMAECYDLLKGILP